MTHSDYAATAGYSLRNPDGATLLLLLHGLGGSRTQSLKLTAGKHFEDATILAPDARAHGATATIGGADAFRFESMADDVLALLQQLHQDGKPTVIAGISMGSALAVRLTLQSSLDIRQLVLIRPAFTDQPFPANLAGMADVAELLRTVGAERGLKEYTASDRYRRIAEVSAAGATSQRGQFTDPGAEQRAIRLAEIPRNTAYRSPAELTSISVPTVVVGAAHDPEHPIALAHLWADIIPTARFVEAPSRDTDPAGYQSFLAQITAAGYAEATAS